MFRNIERESRFRIRYLGSICIKRSIVRNRCFKIVVGITRGYIDPAVNGFDVLDIVQVKLKNFIVIISDDGTTICSVDSRVGKDGEAIVEFIVEVEDVAHLD